MRTTNFFRGYTADFYLNSSNVYIQRLLSFLFDGHSIPENLQVISDSDIADFLSEDVEGLELNDDQMRVIFSDPQWNPHLNLWRTDAQLPVMTQEVYIFCSILVHKYY
jgi:hypothetical protein